MQQPLQVNHPGKPLSDSYALIAYQTVPINSVRSKSRHSICMGMKYAVEHFWVKSRSEEIHSKEKLCKARCRALIMKLHNPCLKARPKIQLSAQYHGFAMITCKTFDYAPRRKSYPLCVHQNTERQTNHRGSKRGCGGDVGM